MSANKVFEIAIGLSFAYVLLSVVASALNEATSAFLALRARTFKDGLEKIVGDAGLSHALSKHPLISGVTFNKIGPTYVAKATFALALIDVVMSAGGKPSAAAPSLTDLRAAVQALPGPATRQALSAILDETVKDISGAKLAFEQWFDSGMARVSGVYKRKSQLVIIAWALGLALSTNADSVQMAKTLANDPDLRAQIVEAATKKLQANAKTSPQKDAGSTDAATKLAEAGASFAEVSSLELPLGWKHDSMPSDALSWLIKLLGILFTSVAISLGAPFWFDTLNRLVNLRATGSPPDRK